MKVAEGQLGKKGSRGTVRNRGLEQFGKIRQRDIFRKQNRRAVGKHVGTGRH